MPPFGPFLMGIVLAPLAKRIIKPVFRGAVKTSVSLVVEARRAVAEAVEDVQDLAAEAAAEMASSDAPAVGG